MVVEHVAGVVVQVVGRLNQPLHVLHRLVQDVVEAFVLGWQLLFGVFSGQDREEGQKLVLVGDGEGQQLGQGMDVVEEAMACFTGKGAVLVVDDAQEGYGVLFHLPPQGVVIIENDD